MAIGCCTIGCCGMGCDTGGLLYIWVCAGRFTLTGRVDIDMLADRLNGFGGVTAVGICSKDLVSCSLVGDGCGTCSVLVENLSKSKVAEKEDPRLEVEGEEEKEL